MKELLHFAHGTFWYCCDFMVSLGNRTHSSYNEANTWVLLLGIPVVLVLLGGVRLVQWWQLRGLRRRLAAARQCRQ